MPKYGWIRDIPDHRDRVYTAPAPVLEALPSRAGLRTNMPPVLNQGYLGACTGHAIGNAHLYCQMRVTKAMGFLAQPSFTPSRLFIYYNERKMEGTVQSDAGATIRNGFKSISREGVCPERLWPYDPKKFSITPPKKCYTEALKHQAIQYRSIPRDLLQMKSVIASGFPFVLGITICESFESDKVSKTGVVPLPKLDERVLGGHAVLCCEYDDKTRRFTAQNCWGEAWGDKGYFTLPYEYLTNPDLSDDFWVLTQIEI